MAKSANRRIETDLSIVMGHCDPEAMIRSRSSDPIRASGQVPRQQAGHMTASGCLRQNAKYPLPAGGHPHMTMEEGGTIEEGGEPSSPPLPPQPVHNTPAHHGLQVLPPQPRQFLGKHRDALLIAARHPRDVRSPEEPFRAE